MRTKFGWTGVRPQRVGQTRHLLIELDRCSRSGTFNSGFALHQTGLGHGVTQLGFGKGLLLVAVFAALDLLEHLEDVERDCFFVL